MGLFSKKPEAVQDGTPKKKKSVLREWLDAAVFAIVVATIIRTFLFEAYTIPTSSMEGSLLVNDYLFVSKMHYGPRIPMTPLAVPFVHNVLPFIGGKSYSDAVKWKYRRLPGFSKIERNDNVVFNYPADMMDEGKRPVDKKENYIKRCVAIAGDTLEVRDGVVYINGTLAKQPRYLQKSYVVNNPTDETLQILDEEQQLVQNLHPQTGELVNNTIYLTEAKAQELMAKGVQLTLIPNLKQYDFTLSERNGNVTYGMYSYPEYEPRIMDTNDKKGLRWNRDFFGPLYLPKKGDKITLDAKTAKIYALCISKYEGHDFKFVTDSTFTIDGKPATEYTFGMNYYFMMGDNRHNSEDGRAWGMVPEDHIVGKAWFVWLSYYKNLAHLRLNRMFRSVKSLE